MLNGISQKTIENTTMEEVKKVPKKRGRKPQNAEAPKFVHVLHQPQKKWRIRNARIVTTIDVDSIQKVVMNE
jgi:hypothetical protein